MATYIPYAETGYFSRLVLDYLNQAPHLQPFYGLPPVIDSFKEQIQQKQAGFNQNQRDVLHKVLVSQHKHIGNVNPAVQANIDLLKKPNTFCVTTGHQVCLFTGPLYFVYKILTAIQTCKKLKELHPEFNFVPVYWMATEDHDFEEVNHFRFQGKTYTWQTNQTGAVGRFSTEGLKELFEQLPERLPLFEQPYLENKTLANATRALVHNLFSEYGVVSIDADEPELKQYFKEAARQDLLTGESQRKVHEASEKLAAYFKMQVTPRPINLFYLKEGLRERIEKNDEIWQVLNTDIQFSEEEILAELEAHSERFSPNVILRPLYQEQILPNLAYIGGGAEVAYWMELKPVFGHFSVPFPIVMLRNSALYIPASLNQRLRKLQLQPEDLFQGQDEIKKRILKEQEGFQEVSLQEHQQQLAAVYAQLLTLAAETDSTLERAVAAAEHRAKKGLVVLERKLNRAAEQRHAIVLHQIEDLFERLFPDGSLQERTVNVATFMSTNSSFISQMLEAFDPFAVDFTILRELSNGE